MKRFQSYYGDYRKWSISLNKQVTDLCASYNVFLDGEFKGRVLMGGTPTVRQCVDELRNNWAIDEHILNSR